MTIAPHGAPAREGRIDPAASAGVHDRRPIVVAVPDDDDAALLRFAAREARLHGCPVHLVHVRQHDDGEDVDPVLADAVARTELLAGPGVPVTGAVVTGAPVAAVLDASDDALGVVVRQRDTLHLMRAIGEDGRPGGDPVVVCVPSAWSEPPEDDDRPVLVGVGDLDASGDLIVRALGIAHDHRTALRVLHAWRFPRRYDALIDARIGGRWSEDVRATLTRAVARCRAGTRGDVPVEILVEHGVPADLLVDAARRAQLVVLERNRAGAGPEHVGRTSRTALHECPCPVVLLPPGRAGP
ncbi:universal stress protein [Nocardioides hungaricus]